MNLRTPAFPRQAKLPGDHGRALETARNRLVIAGAMFAAAFLVIGARVIDLTLVSRGAEPRIAEAAADAGIATERAEIVDRNGALLATSLATSSLYANPRVMLDPVEAARRLVTVLPELSEADVRAKLTSDRTFVWLRRNLTPRQQYAVNALGIPGLEFQREERRVYPLGPTAAHVLGFTDIDNRGLAGVERSLDETLRSSHAPLQLSLDVRVQHILAEETKRAIETFRAIGGAGVVMDATNGEVLAMVSLPDFDPNRPGSVAADVRFNRASLGVYEMGSTFKIFTTAAALDAGTVTMSGGYDATQPIRIGRFSIRDYHGKRRWLSVPEIFMYSSNIGAAKMAMAVGTARQRDFLDRIGLLREAPIELPEVGQPLVPEPWRDINTLTIGFGHGVAVSPVQTAAATAAMVNGGIYHQPTLIKHPQGAPATGRRVISERTSDNIRRLMRLVVDDGTGKNADAPGYLVGGKTGTAEKASRHGYKVHALLSSFAGAFPIHAPRYVVLIVIDEPVGNKATFGYATGGWTAAPVVKRVVERMAAVFDMPPQDKNAPEIVRALHLELNGQEAPKRLASN